MDHAFLFGDNSGMTATDTQKNAIYYLAKTQCGFGSGSGVAGAPSAEVFSRIVSEFFVEKYPLVRAAKCIVTEKPWKRLEINNDTNNDNNNDNNVRGQGRGGKGMGIHKHGFVLDEGLGTREATAITRRISNGGDGGRFETIVTSNLLNLTLLKTTQSGYEGYLRDELTLLPETRERLLASSVSAFWSYTVDFHSKNKDWSAMFGSTSSSSHDHYDAIATKVKHWLLQSFFGDAHKGIYSPSVQFTMHKMGKAVIENIPEIESITLKMPNIHFLPWSMPGSNRGGKGTGVAQFGGAAFEDDVYIATSEPHGIIEATITRNTLNSKKVNGKGSDIENHPSFPIARL